MKSQYAYMQGTHTPITTTDFQRFCADHNTGRTFSGGVRIHQFPPVVVLMEVTAQYSWKFYNLEVLLHNNLEILPGLQCNWSEKFEWLLHSKVEMLLHINFGYCIDILKCYCTEISKCQCTAILKMLLHTNLGILLFSNLEFSLSSDFEMLLHINLELLLLSNLELLLLINLEISGTILNILEKRLHNSIVLKRLLSSLL